MTRAATILLACCALAVGCDDDPAEDDGGPPGVDAATPTDAGGTDAGGDDEDAGGTDAGAVDGGADAGMADAGTDAGVVPEVQCGDTVCAETEVCCVVPGAEPETSCTAPDACEDGIPAFCDGPEDCATGEACCAMTTGTAPELSITVMCGAPEEATCNFEACHTAADCSEAGMMCCPSPLGVGNVCSASCD